MAEIRKHDPDAGEGIARLVREHMGDVRPVEPGEKPAAEPEVEQAETDDDAVGFSGLPSWDEDGPTFQF
ncbi:hypothetical protein GCM10028820_18500 [Tessaracoccus terricola]